jgi:hypothetical protein
LCHHQNLLRTRRSGITTRAYRYAKKTPPKWGKEIKETINSTWITSRHANIATLGRPFTTIGALDAEAD